MKEQIAEILFDKITYHKDIEEACGVYDASQEITDHVFQFIEWLVLHCTGDIFYLGYDENDNIIWYNAENNIKYTKNELYKFWYDNVFSKTKKG